jgi:hypothetical protein
VFKNGWKDSLLITFGGVVITFGFSALAICLFRPL